MYKLQKKLISLGLLLCFLSSIFHIHPHFHNHQDSFSIYDVGNEKEIHNSFSNHCEKCLVNHYNSEVQDIIEKFTEASLIVFTYNLENYKKHNYIFKLYSRPPPISVA